MDTEARDDSIWRRPAKRVPLREGIRGSLEDLITHGILEPGEHLSEGLLAERFGVSRQPVREAFQMLAQSGFVDLLTDRGAFVHVPTAQEVNDLFDVRILLEAECARRAAKSITKQAVAKLGVICSKGFDALEKNDKRTLIDLNHEFHLLITEFAGNVVMADILSRVERRVSTYLASIISGRAPLSWKEHHGIYLAMDAADSDRASKLMAEHIAASRKLLGLKYDPALHIASAGAASSIYEVQR